MSLSQTVDVETPELVVISYTIAGVGSRTSAAIIDYLICFVAALVIIIGGSFLSAGVRAGWPQSADRTTAWAVAVLTIFQFVLLWLYYVLFEALADGQTPGKRFMRLRVVRDGGLSVNFEASAIRNLVRIVDMQPFLFYSVGLTSVIVNGRGKRLGDLAAGTIVVKEALVAQPMTVPQLRPGVGALVQPLTARLTDAEYQVLDRFVVRRMELDAERRSALATGLASRMHDALDPESTLTPVVQLVRLHEEEQRARAHGMAARNDTGAARERHAIVATGASRWKSFARQLELAQTGGLKRLGENGVREFVAQYRELTADLARLRTATRGSEAAEVFYLNRLVSGAHNLLYRRRSLTLRRTIQFLFVEVPAEIRASVAPIGLAAVLLFAPMAIAARGVIVQPALAGTLVGPAMIARAEKGVENARKGKGYIDDPQMLRPLFASNIMANNIQVVFMAFAMGVTAGVMTVFVLVSNGISIGAMFGLYASKGIFTLILAFVAPHGVLELTAIVIGGGAGLLLAAGMLIPGIRTRRTAFAENGRRAIRLVAGAAFLLVFAGSLEGFVSPIETWPLRYKLVVSAITTVALVGYLFPWARVRGAAIRKTAGAPVYSAPRALSSR